MTKPLDGPSHVPFIRNVVDLAYTKFDDEVEAMRLATLVLRDCGYDLGEVADALGESTRELGILCRNASASASRGPAAHKLLLEVKQRRRELNQW